MTAPLAAARRLIDIHPDDPSPASLADRFLLGDTEPQAILRLIESGAFGMDELWETVPASTRYARLAARAQAPLPRILQWAQNSLHQTGTSDGRPSPEGWEALARQEGRKSGYWLTPSDRLLAWAFTDPRAWDRVEMRGAGFLDEEEVPVDLPTWAAGRSAWLLDVLLSHPGRPALDEEWFKQRALEAVKRSGRWGLDVLLHHGPSGLANARFVDGKARPSGAGDGEPLLHLARNRDVVNTLLSHGADPLAIDSNGMTADQYWRRSMASDLSSRLDSQNGEAMLKALTEAVGKLAPNERQKAVMRRQELSWFKKTLPSNIEGWLRKRPANLVLGEQAVLPHQALLAIDDTAADRCRRAAALVAHESQAALARLGPGGVSEGDVLWWSVAAGAMKTHSRTLLRGWPEMAREGAWLERLDALGRLDAWASVQGQPEVAAVGCVVAHRDMAEAAMRIVGRGLDVLRGKDGQQTAIGLLTPLAPQDWDRPFGDGPSPLDRAVRAGAQAAATAQARLGHGRGTIAEGEVMEQAFQWLAFHLRSSPKDALGQPRAHLLDSLLAWAVAAQRLDRKLTAQQTRAIWEGQAPESHWFATELLQAIRTLADDGVVPGRDAVRLLEQADLPALAPLAAWARGRRLETRLARAEDPGRRPGIRL